MKAQSSTYNFEKHTSENPIQKLLINNFNRELLGFVQNLKPKNILDVGCGEGFTLSELKQNNIKAEMEGVDSLNEAIELGNRTNPDLKLRKGDIYNLNYKDNSFDVVLCTEVLEHLTDPKKALAELKRVTKRYLILSVPNEPWFTIQRFLRGKNTLGLGSHPEHIQWWTNSTFQEFVKSLDLKILNVKSPFAWTLVLSEK